MKNPTKRRLLRPRFTLGALLVLILLCALPLAYIASVRATNAARCAAWERLQAKGVRFELDIPASSTVLDLERGWWEKLLNATPKFRSIEVLEVYTAGKPPALFITDEELRLFVHFSEIEKVSLTGVENITDAGLSSLSALPNLRNFESNLLARIDGSFLKEWAESDTIETLWLINMTRFQGQKLVPLEKMTRLKALTLNSAVYLDQTSLDGVNMPPQLTELRILHTPVTDDALARWLSQTQLRTLNLDTAFSRKIAPALRNQIHLSHLSIANAPLIDDDLMFLGRCPALYNLSLVGLPIEGAFLRRLPRRSPIDFVTLRAAPLKEENLDALHRINALIHLDLAWTPINGQCFEGIAWKSLQYIDLQGTYLSDQGKSDLVRAATPSHITFPSNFSASDAKQYLTGKGAMFVTLNERFARGNPILTASYYGPGFQLPKIDRCPPELMKPVQDLIDRAKAEEAELKAKAEQ